MSGDHIGELIFMNDLTSWKHFSKPTKTTNRDLPIMYFNPLEAVETGTVSIWRSARSETEPHLEATILSQNRLHWRVCKSVNNKHAAGRHR